ncbi:hypothetical protein Tco_1529681, partial [Tanacetum coccineum]
MQRMMVMGYIKTVQKGTRRNQLVKKNVGQGSGMHYEGYDNGNLLMAVSEERFLEWIMDSGGSFHMMPRKDFLFDFKEFNGGTVLLGDNRARAIRGTGNGFTVKLQNGRDKVIKGSLMVLSRTIKGNCKHLGHISEAGLHELEKREVLGNKGLGKLEFCENYVLGKSTRLSFGREATTTASYLINRSPSTTLEKKTPMDL